MGDFISAFRSLARSPALTTLAVLMLAFGLGGTAAIFSLVDTVLLRPLPVVEPERLVLLDRVSDRGDITNLSYPFYERVRDDREVFDGVFAVADDLLEVELAGPEAGAQVERANLAFVSGRYFDILGVRAAAGRTFTAADEDRQSPTALSVVLSHRFWMRRLGGRSDVVGTVLTIEGHRVAVAGIAPAAFFGETLGRVPDLWAPLVAQPDLYRAGSILDANNVGWLRVFGRRRAGVTAEQTRAALDVLIARLQAETQQLSPANRHPARVQMSDGRRGLSRFRDQFVQPLQILFGVVAIVLLVACANVANLLLARATMRRREVVIRLALGASRARLARLLLTESAALAACAAVLGLVVAAWGTRALLSLASPDAQPIPVDASIDVRVIAFTFLTAVVAVVLFGLAPALTAARVDLQAALRQTTVSEGRARLPRALIVVQIALSLALLTGAALFLHSSGRLQSHDLGFATDAVAQVDIFTEGYRNREVPALKLRLLEQLTAIPGVDSASTASFGLGGRGPAMCCIAVEGHAPAAGENRQVRTFDAGPSYFQTMRQALLEGRDFTAADRSDDPTRRPVRFIVNQAFARRYFGGDSALGKRFGWGDPPDVNYENEIVGVVRDALHGGPRLLPEPVIYTPSLTGNTFVIRTSVAPEALLQPIRLAIDRVDRRLVRSIGTLSDARARAAGRETLLATLTSFFGVVATALAACGLFGLMAYTVARRSKDIAIRIALGAGPAAIRRSELRSAFGLALAGLILGVPLVVALGGAIGSQLFGISPTDPATLVEAGLLLVGVTLAAAYVPALRASRVDPLLALKAD